MTTTATPSPVRTARDATYGGQMSVVLCAAFVLSAVHTVYAWLAGIDDPSFTVTTPVAWAFYAVSFAVSALVRRRERWVQWVVMTYLAVLLAVSVFVYPTRFEPRQQTTFGWFENDVYVALLVLAFYLGWQRLRRVTLSPGAGAD